MVVSQFSVLVQTRSLSQLLGVVEGNIYAFHCHLFCLWQMFVLTLFKGFDQLPV